MSFRFEEFFTELAINEGWESHNAFDPGGKTICGVTEKFFPEEYRTIVYMIESGYEMGTVLLYIRSFYFINFWNPMYDKISDSSLAFKLFDFGVNASVRKSVKILQRTHNIYNDRRQRVVVDGIFGKKTMVNINMDSHPQTDEIETKFYQMYVDRVEKYYRSLKNFFVFGKGLLNRTKKVFNGVPNLVAIK